jgi:hypothetical protein
MFPEAEYSATSHFKGGSGCLGWNLITRTEKAAVCAGHRKVIETVTIQHNESAVLPLRVRAKGR